jgi:hypothetical protein
MFFGQEAQDLFSKLSGRPSQTEESMDIGGLLGSWGGTKAEVERESERPANSWNTANDVGTVDRAAVPGISSGMGSLDKHSVSAAIIGRDADSFIQKAMEVFNTNSFVVTTGSHMDINMQKGADSLEDTFEGAAVVNNEETTKANFEKNFLDEEPGEIMGCDVAGSIDQDEACKITHSVQEVTIAAIVGNITRGPEVNVEDVKGTAEGPRKDELAVTGDGTIGRDAVGTL